MQHRIAEQGEAVWKLLEQGAHFYVCGDATRMAGDVEDALLEVIAARTAGGREGAVQYLEDMKAADRYQRDVWFS